MADTMKFDLVSPERRLVSGDARSVQLPGSDGDMTAMPDHAPTITTLRPGILSVEMSDGVQEFAVFGGFAEVTTEGTTVLAEAAMPKAEVTREYLDERLAAARAEQEKAEPDMVDSVAKLVADLVAMGDTINLPTSSRVPAP